MKKILLLLTILLLVLTGCFNKSLKDKFIDMTTEYYEKVFKDSITDDVVEVKITLNNLNVYGYNTKDFIDCDENSSVIFKLEMKKKKRVITEKIVNLDCKEKK